MKKTLAGIGIGLAATLALTGTASAHNCVNLSRKAPTTQELAAETQKGNWVAAEGAPGWLFVGPLTLIEGTGACGNENRLAGQTKADGAPNGIWTLDCAVEAGFNPGP
jgi:hypothetical protein